MPPVWQYVNHRRTFPLSDCEVYTDKSFFSEQAKVRLGPNWTNPFLGASIGFITSFPLDYMHLVCLGVMRRSLSFWLRGPLKTRMSSKYVEALSKLLIELRPYTPSEFVRNRGGQSSRKIYLSRSIVTYSKMPFK